MTDFVKILVPVDFSENSARAIETAVMMAHSFGGSLTLLHVFDTYYIGEGFYLSSGFDVTSVMEEITEQKREKLDQLASEIEKGGIKTEAKVKNGVPHTVILEFAEQSKCDLIVMGREGGRPVSDLLLGSVATKVAGRAPCSVLIVRSKEAREGSILDRVVAELKSRGLVDDLQSLLRKAGFFGDPNDKD